MSTAIDPSPGSSTNISDAILNDVSEVPCSGDSTVVNVSALEYTGKMNGFSWKTFAKFVGPGYMVAVGYLDPGNWATDLAAGSQFGYRLLFIVLLSNLMAVLLQSLCIKLGIVTGRDLAQACRRYFPAKLNILLYILCELAIIATDIAEVIGTAIALKLLFNLPLPLGVVVTSLDVLVILMGWDVKHIRLFEWFIIFLMATCGVCFAMLVGKSHPNWRTVFTGFLPTPEIYTESGQLYIAMGIIGATVMPHNLYLHSSIVKYRAPGRASVVGAIHEIEACESDSEDESYQPLLRKSNLPVALRMTHLDSVIALTFALSINSAILIVAAANFYGSEDKDVAELEDAFVLLQKYLGTSAGILFAVALLFSGQSSTITGTMAGQIIMEGFLGTSFRLRPWIRRLVTRVVAIIPAMIVALVEGDRGVNDLLVFSQVVLSLQLPFAVWPLVYFTSSKRVMTLKFEGTGPAESSETDSLVDTRYGPKTVEEDASEVSYANGVTTTVLAVVVATLITMFNVILIVQVAMGKS
ncbi:metal ion (Mn2+/Fe2+) transporter (Nramp) family metal ion transporter [Spizellomyces punctatus DAOM BR117]|uniref:Metal ion (Mn2+/Fe2+) transporter (Nramp) family metal ion transporter n=1 Tax=Spizellomyces punctatus (strain DAOM BR117) TaxID=645134 RepID=A0A0L0HF24_SPIPD|nr:metal ion (Mn2+/Fe2+) transporter (Nramp) family metal ion transporter [Spizellomyces punctatus DAOM BR117]KNC99702.1 metal ion (Mn2+/Fe2+) transporter (Nramp) family metal ion transporter [Spizellomyces punctatus DAOM BR117]|eukprot:XP_016607742.1 metal ion (Mn2+/Fe2+) transporter (Nramp) family metal ion transporter [Spizellomyces punctatus DAOM BR117]